MISLLLVLLVMTTTGCNSDNDTAGNVDSIRIRHNHYAANPSEITFSINKSENINKLLDFFEDLDFSELSDENESPEDFDGGGHDYIDYMSDWVSIRQYVIYGANSNGSGDQMFIRFEEDGPWYKMSEDSGSEWSKFIYGLLSDETK